ncbi:MAG: methyltransferase domain-containing protein [Ferruginibacter sp.]
MEDTWFKGWFNSPYYHQLYAYRDKKEAADFIDKLILRLKPPVGATMLDVACGKGRHSMQLAEKGFDVTGIDLSHESIREALKHESDNLHFYEHDMRLPFWINYYRYAFNFFTSFGYFNTQREHDNAIRTISQALKPGGIFVMDFLNVNYSEKRGIEETEKQLGAAKYSICKWTDRGHFYKKITVEDPALAKPLQYTEKVSKFSLNDFEKMFARQSLEITEVYGDYHFNTYHAQTSPRLIMIAEKK